MSKKKDKSADPKTKVSARENHDHDDLLGQRTRGTRHGNSEDQIDKKNLKKSRKKDLGDSL